MATNMPVLYDTLTRTKQPLRTLEPGVCRVYCCGPTVYDLSHIGHARAALLPDVLVRVLQDTGLKVVYARNITDIDDKIIHRALENREDPSALAERFTRAYHEDLAALGMLLPDVEPKVSTHMPEIVALIERLVAQGLAYAVEGDVYFEVRKFADYGALSKRSLDDMQAGARVDVDPRKKDPADFALWKAAKPGEPHWESPWGPGRPGWHIECSAMSCKHLGETFDIHTGGRDLIFPHHENELAQSRGAYGPHSFAQVWMHNGFVNFAGEKMSKSLGNFFTIREVTRIYHPEVLRYFLLCVHYRSGVNFDVEVPCPGCGRALSHDEQQATACASCHAVLSPEILRDRVRFPGLEEADERLAYVYETLESAQSFVAKLAHDPTAPAIAEVRDMLPHVHAAMLDDLNTAQALAALSEPLSVVNRLLGSAKGVAKDVRAASIASFARDMPRIAKWLGLFEREPASYLLARRDLKAARVGLDTTRVQTLVAQREDARAQKDWTRADTVRDELATLGVSIRDGEGGTRWSL